MNRYLLITGSLSIFLALTNCGNSTKSVQNFKPKKLISEPISTTANSKAETDSLIDDSLKASIIYVGRTVYNSCFTSEKIDTLLKVSKESTNEILYPNSNKKITENEFNSLNAKEHFIHSIEFPESFFQSCYFAMMPENINEVIPAHLKFKGEGLRMSSRQSEALRINRDSTILLKDNYILTTLCLLIKNESEHFRETHIYKNLYLDNNSSERYFKRSIPYSELDEKLIIDLSMSCHKKQLDEESSFIKIKGGAYQLGNDEYPLNPPRKVELADFKISKYEITNEQFQQFVNETGYETTAEKNKDALVFRPGLKEFEWEEDPSAYWKFPNGLSQGGIENKMDHPVTCISHEDALRYCSWANYRLPTIEEWEIASRGENPQLHFYTNSENIHTYANIWHGKNHLNVSDAEDFIYTSPVGSFQPNPLGLYDVYGNVFEFCSNTPEGVKAKEKLAATRGGSWWCSEASCSAFNSYEIGRVHQKASFSNNGFRVVKD